MLHSIHISYRYHFFHMNTYRRREGVGPVLTTHKMEILHKCLTLVLFNHASQSVYVLIVMLNEWIHMF